jgi:hypothetical protein
MRPCPCRDAAPCGSRAQGGGKAVSYLCLSGPLSERKVERMFRGLALSILLITVGMIGAPVAILALV